MKTSKSAQQGSIDAYAQVNEPRRRITRHTAAGSFSRRPEAPAVRHQPPGGTSDALVRRRASQREQYRQKRIDVLAGVKPSRFEQAASVYEERRMRLEQMRAQLRMANGGLPDPSQNEVHRRGFLDQVSQCPRVDLPTQLLAYNFDHDAYIGIEQATAWEEQRQIAEVEHKVAAREQGLQGQLPPLPASAIPAPGSATPRYRELFEAMYLQTGDSRASAAIINATFGSSISSADATLWAGNWAKRLYTRKLNILNFVLESGVGAADATSHPNYPVRASTLCNDIAEQEALAEAARVDSVRRAFMAYGFGSTPMSNWEPTSNPSLNPSTSAALRLMPSTTMTTGEPNDFPQDIDASFDFDMDADDDEPGVDDGSGESSESQGTSQGTTQVSSHDAGPVGHGLAGDAQMKAFEAWLDAQDELFRTQGALMPSGATGW